MEDLSWDKTKITQAFIDAIENPPEPNQALISAAKRYNDTVTVKNNLQSYCINEQGNITRWSSEDCDNTVVLAQNQICDNYLDDEISTAPTCSNCYMPQFLHEDVQG